MNPGVVKDASGTLIADKQVVLRDAAPVSRRTQRQGAMAHLRDAVKPDHRAADRNYQALQRWRYQLARETLYSCLSRKI